MVERNVIHKRYCVGLGESCSDPGTPAGADQVATSYKEGAIVTFNCTQPGFEPSDENEWKCTASASAVSWSQTSLPTCIGEYFTFISYTVYILPITDFFNNSLPTVKLAVEHYLV